MKNLSILAMLVAVLAFSSCKKVESNPYQGTYSGTFAGDDTGIWSGTVNESGNMDGTGISSTVPGIPFELKGQVDNNGHFTANLNIPLLGAIAFDGQITNGQVTGTWVNVSSQIQGTFEGAKD